MYDGRLAAKMATDNFFISVYIFHSAHQEVDCFFSPLESGLGL